MSPRFNWDFWSAFFLRVILPLFFIFLIFSFKAMGYPEMSRHGYASCIACHVSPSGGGILTAYGKVQSEELLALWKLGVEPKESPLSLGAQIRVLQIQQETKKAFRRAFVLMQADAEAAATYKAFTVAGTLGSDNGKPFSRRHYVIAKPFYWMHVRLGKFMPFFGLGLPDHNLAIRDAFGPGSERYSIETGVTYEKGSTFLTYSKGEGVLRQAINLGTSQIGFGLRVTEQVFEGGAFAVWPALDHLFLLAEAIYSERAHRGYARLQYQPINGLGFYCHRQEFKDQFSGVGLHLIPVSGAEIKTEINKTDVGYFALVMGNLWL